MRGVDARRLLILEPGRRRYRLRTLRPAVLDKDPRAEYLMLSGEALCQYLLCQDPDALVIARGPLPFLSGNKTTVGYISPLTGLPHYSFVGGRTFVELLNLGLDAIVLSGSGKPAEYVIISGRAPHLTVEWKPATDSSAGGARPNLPSGQRAAFYWLLDRELDSQRDRGSIFVVGEGARWGYRTANLGVDGLYHAGRGGAGGIFARFAAAMVLRGEPLSLDRWFGPRAGAFRSLRDGEIRQRLAVDCARFARRDGGTIAKLYATGRGKRPTLPAHNAQQLGYDLADLGAGKVLKASRVGQTGCHWCQVNCRHWHWIDVDYAPGGRDTFLDDFEPTYAIFAMLDLRPEEDSLRGKLQLLEEAAQQVIVPIEQMGCDVIDIGVGLAALFEGLERGLLPRDDLPPFLRAATRLGNLELVAQTIAAMRQGDPSPALRALGDGPQALAERYPDLQEAVFTCGRGTLGNPGHANALWTFLMPFSRFFSHYSGQIYKIEEELDPDAGTEEVQALFERVIRQMLQREFYGCLGNALSMCAFTFAIFGQDRQSVVLDDGDLLLRTLACYGIESSREELEWSAEAFWAQSIALKLAHGWQPPIAADFPIRVFESLSLALNRPTTELQALMDQLIAEWKRQAGQVLYKYGYEIGENWQVTAPEGSPVAAQRGSPGPRPDK
jgi:aldehyde:ferredoxin oxidoreductase